MFLYAGTERSGDFKCRQAGQLIDHATGSRMFSELPLNTECPYTPVWSTNRSTNKVKSTHVHGVHIPNSLIIADARTSVLCDTRIFVAEQTWVYHGCLIEHWWNELEFIKTTGAGAFAYITVVKNSCLQHQTAGPWMFSSISGCAKIVKDSFSFVGHKCYKYGSLTERSKNVCISLSTQKCVP